MKNLIRIIGIIFLLVLVMLVINRFYNYKDEYYIKDQIENSNYCNTKDDCVRSATTCKYGCNIFVNKNEVARINNLMWADSGGCELECGTLEEFDCINNKCMSVKNE